MTPRTTVALYLPEEAETALITYIDTHSRILSITRRCADLAEVEAAAVTGTATLAVINGADPDIDIHILSRLHTRGMKVVLTRVSTPTGETINTDQLRALGADGVAALHNPQEITAELEHLVTGHKPIDTPTPMQEAPQPREDNGEFHDIIASLETPNNESNNKEEQELPQRQTTPETLTPPLSISPQQFPPRRNQQHPRGLRAWWKKRRSHIPSLPAPHCAIAEPTAQINPFSSTEDTSPPEIPKSDAGRVIAVFGTNGAPGRTTTAIHLASCLGQKYSVALLDADTQAPSVAHALGISIEGSSLSALARFYARGTLTPSHCQEVAYEVNQSFCVLTGLTSPHRWREADPSTVNAIIEASRNKWEYTIIDLHATSYEPLDDYHRHVPHRDHLLRDVLEVADAIVVVTRADTLGLHRLADTLEWLEEAAPEKPCLLVANMADSARTGNNPAHAISVALSDIAPGEPITVIPLDPDVNRALLRGQVLSSRRSKGAITAFEELADRIQDTMPHHRQQK